MLFPLIDSDTAWTGPCLRRARLPIAIVNVFLVLVASPTRSELSDLRRTYVSIDGLAKTGARLPESPGAREPLTGRSSRLLRPQATYGSPEPCGSRVADGLRAAPQVHRQRRSRIARFARAGTIKGLPGRPRRAGHIHCDLGSCPARQGPAPGRRCAPFLARLRRP